MFLRQWSSRRCNLASYIRIEEGQFFFDLNKEALLKIRRIRSKQISLHVPCKLLISLMYHALLKKESFDGNEKVYTYLYLQPGLSFCTCYSNNIKVEHTYSISEPAEKKKVIQSLISPSGDILHQICCDALHYPNFLEISAAHHWLTAQLLKQSRVNLNWIPQLLWFSSTAYSFWQFCLELHKLSVDSALWLGIYLVLQFVLPPFWRWLQPCVIRFILSQLISPNSKVNYILRLTKLA